jgi:neopullulanase
MGRRWIPEEGTPPLMTAIHDRPTWVADAVFYQIFPDRFARSGNLPKPANLEPWDSPPTVHGYKGGDLVGIAERLDWLQDLGITALYLNPILQSAANHRYHPHDYYRVDPLLGGDAGFETLLAAAHGRGMRVVLDGVFNHASRGFFQFNDILENGAGSPWIDWFTVHDPEANAYDETQPPGYLGWWGMHALPKFNTGNPQVREYLMGVAEHWIERGADGWRLDVPQEIKTDGFWEEFRSRVRAANPDAYIVGEIWDPAPDWVNAGTRFDGVMNYPLTEAALRFAGQGHLDHVINAPVNLKLDVPLDAASYREAVSRLLETYGEDALQGNLNLLGSHDTPRALSMVGEDRAALTLAVVVLLTFPGAPCIYYGDEIGMKGPHDPGCRAAFPWDDAGSWDRGLLGTFRELIVLRHREAAFRHGSYRHLAADGNAYAFAREHEGARLVVALNAGDGATSLQLGEGAGGAERLWGSGDAGPSPEGIALGLPARSAGIWAMR